MRCDGRGLLPAGNPNPPGGLGAVYGMAFSSDVQITQASTGCITSGTFPLAGTAMPGAIDVGTANAVRVLGGPPFTPAALLADLCLLPTGIVQAATGETLWFHPSSPTFAVFPTATDASGTASFGITFTGIPAGIQFSFQWALLDVAHPLNLCLTDACTLTLGLR